MEQLAVIMADLAERFEMAMEQGRAVLFNAPCGFGKTTTARALTEGK